MYFISSPSSSATNITTWMKYGSVETSNSQAVFNTLHLSQSSALIMALVNEILFTLESLQRNASKY